MDPEYAAMIQRKREMGRHIPRRNRSAFQFYVAANLYDASNPEVKRRWKNLHQPNKSVYFFEASIDFTRYKNAYNICQELQRQMPRCERYVRDDPVPTEFLPTGYEPIVINPPIEVDEESNRKMDMMLGVAEKPLSWPATQPWHADDLICYVKSVVPGGYADKVGFKAGDLPFLFYGGNHEKDGEEVYTLIMIEVMLQILARLPCKIYVLRSNVQGAIRPHPIAGELGEMGDSMAAAST
jgi:hypothetical protein